MWLEGSREKTKLYGKGRTEDVADARKYGCVGVASVACAHGFLRLEFSLGFDTIEAMQRTVDIPQTRPFFAAPANEGCDAA